MARNAFDNDLDILRPTPEDLQKHPGLQLSVCAMGDVATGAELMSMRVWMFQRVDDKLAVSTGTGDVHLGGHDPVPSEDFPVKDRWMVQTELVAGFEQFSPGPALGVAMARVRRTAADGTPEDEVDFWTQPVVIVEHEHPHD